MDMDENENAKLLAMIDQILKENPGTNFERCFPQHFAIFLKYVDSARKKQLGCFPDRETYEAFSSAKLFFDKLKFAVFQKDDETQNIENEDFNIPPLEAFHNTVDEIEMKKNRILESINKGDVLHLKVVEEETEKYKLQILNKYGDKQRIIDLSLFANLLKYNPLVRNINPPLQIGDLVRAAAFGNVKTEEGEYKKLIVSLNPNVVTDNELKHLKLGRIFKKDIPYYPNDISQFKSLGEYLKANGKFESPEDNLKNIRSFGCDPLKTGPLYETRYKKQIPNDIDRSLLVATEKLHITYSKTRDVAELLKKNCLKKEDLLNALLEIEAALETYPENDLALTIRGKIYLALANGKPSRKVKKAFLDFEAAMKINPHNEEAAELRDAILKESWRSFKEKNMLENAQKIEDHLRKRSLSVASEEFLENVKKQKFSQRKASFPVETGTSSSQVPIIKEEAMDTEAVKAKF